MSGQQRDRLSYCIVCRKDTATVSYEVSILPPFIKSQRRICKQCGKPKLRTETEKEWVEKP